MNFNDVVTARRGTLRRKQQLRELLDAHDRGYEDNIFDSTPYRQRQRTIKVFIIHVPFNNKILVSIESLRGASKWYLLRWYL